jgi:aromatic ring hydroxylase
MPARTSEQYLQGLRENAAEVYLDGERVLDVTNHPYLKGGITSIGQLLDMQHEPRLIDEIILLSRHS